MQDILTLILISKHIYSPPPMSVAEAEKLFYDRAAPHAGAFYSLRRRFAARRKQHHQV